MAAASADAAGRLRPARWEKEVSSVGAEVWRVTPGRLTERFAPAHRDRFWPPLMNRLRLFAVLHRFGLHLYQS